jgi:hypothetical protein
MKKFPKVTIVLGSYKDEKAIGDTLKHMATELKYPNLEIFVAVDTHEDHTIDVVRKMAKRYKKIRVDFSETRRGVTKALASALKKATGEIILHSASDYRYRNPSKVLFNLVKYYEDPSVGGVIVSSPDPPFLDEQRKGNINEYSQIAMYRLVRDWKNQFKVIQGKPKFPVICHSFRRKLIDNIDVNSINDDAEFAFSVLDKGYKIVTSNNVKFYSMIETTTPKAILLRQSRTTAGWFKISKKRDINLFRYYFSVYWYFLTHFYRYSIYEIISINYAILMFLVSMFSAYKKQKQPPTKAWQVYDRKIKHESTS